MKSGFVCGWKSTTSKVICRLDFLVWFRWGIQVFFKFLKCRALFHLVHDEPTLHCTVLHSCCLQFLGDICAPHFVTCGTSSQSLPTPLSPAFSGLCFSWWGLPGCGDAVSICRSSLGGSCWAQPFPTQAGSLGLAEAGMFLECEWALDFVWSALGACPFGYTPPSVAAQNKHCANRQSLKQAITENYCASTKIKTNQSGQWLQESVFAWSVF